MKRLFVSTLGALALGLSDNTTDGVEPKDAKTFYDAAANHLC